MQIKQNLDINVPPKKGTESPGMATREASVRDLNDEVPSEVRQLLNGVKEKSIRGLKVDP